MIPYSRQYIDKDDIKNVVKVLKSGLITQGKQVPLFEKRISSLVKAKYGVATNSATSALHVACLALGLKKNDILWTVPNTFVASANCALYCHAKIDFVDIDERTLNISIKNLEKKLKIAKRKNKLPKIVVPIDFAGSPYDQKKLFDLSKKYHFKIVEDAAHSLGSKFNGSKIGSGKWTDVSVFSFHPVKPITTAEGGMALTNNKKLYKKMLIFRNHGINKTSSELKKKGLQKWYYEQQFLGYNYRMNDVQAALGLSQIKKLSSFVKKRNIIAKRYIKELKNLPIKFQKINPKTSSTYHLFIITFPKKRKIINNYNKIFKEFINNKIGVNLHYLPVHLHPYYKKLGFRQNMFPISESYSKRSLSIPIFHKLTNGEQSKIINFIRYICKKYC